MHACMNHAYFLWMLAWKRRSPLSAHRETPRGGGMHQLHGTLHCMHDGMVMSHTRGGYGSCMAAVRCRDFLT
jgi:hypothetical protein